MKIFFLTDHFERYEQCGLISASADRRYACPIEKSRMSGQLECQLSQKHSQKKS